MGNAGIIAGRIIARNRAAPSEEPTDGGFAGADGGGDTECSATAHTEGHTIGGSAAAVGHRNHGPWGGIAKVAAVLDIERGRAPAGTIQHVEGQLQATPSFGRGRQQACGSRSWLMVGSENLLWRDRGWQGFNNYESSRN